MLVKTNKILFFLFCWVYNLNRCLISATQVEAQNDPNHSNHYNQQLAYANSQSVPDSHLEHVRAFPFVIDPLIIIALIALPTIGLLGLSSLIMPLIPIGIYLIQLFFPIGGTGKRRKREINHNLTSVSETDYNNEIQHFVTHLSKAFDKYTDNDIPLK